MNQEQPNIAKPLKRTRVSRACNFCRRKKIKCDIDKQYPCSSCVQYCCDCTSNDSPKKRPPPKGYIESLERRLRQMEQLLENKIPRTDTEHEKNDNNNSSSTNSSSINRSNTPSGGTTDVHNAKVMRHIGISSPYYLMGKQKQEEERQKLRPVISLNKDAKLSGDNDNDDYNSNELDQPTLLVSNGLGRKLELVYDDDNNDLMVIHDQAPPQHLLKQHRNESGLDDILSGNIIGILAQKFIDLRPVILPMIGKRSILEATHNSSLNPLLTSSICSYVAMMLPNDDETFENYGIDRRDLIQKLATKENELLRTAFLTPTISNIQAIIILCCQPTHISIFTGIWLRTGIAIRMSQDLGLHRPLTNTSHSKQVRELGKTLWHCVYILDRWSCAVLGRPLAIVDSDCNVDLPEYSKSNNKDIDNIGDTGLDGDEDEDEQNHTIFILFVKLSGILGEIQRRIYSPKAKASLGVCSTSTTKMVNSLQRLLLEWYDQVPPYARLTKSDVAHMASPSITKEEKTMLLQTKQWQLGGSLMICYCAVTILLHRPFIIPDSEILFSPASAERCTESAIFATDVVQLMDVQSFTHFYWNIIIFSLSVVISIHMFNCISDQRELSKTARQHLRILIDLWDVVDSEFPYTPKLAPLTPLHYAVQLLGLKGISPKQSQSATSLASTSSSSTHDNDSTDDTNDGNGNADNHETTTIPEHNQHAASDIYASTESQVYYNAKTQEQHQLQPQQLGSQPFKHSAMENATSMTYMLQENIPTSSNNDFPATEANLANNSAPSIENQLLDNESWQQIFLNNMGPNPFDFSDNKNGDDFWQNNYSLF
ncbi:fungal-specific transcription factor domain-domain-containing protein [Absidia repens]|uniref:Fungal-specific transcription factor domain-domain-containing protein n=1 Tax=Absidia repens TaxID=90262 RepID=A0A1X2I7B7_9FUNG|nr:fungal-specific transcription factor domain-domain-containing protein [Absidia repens]